MPNIPFQIARDFKKTGGSDRPDVIHAAEDRRGGTPLRLAQLLVLAIGGCALSWAILLGAHMI